MSAQSACAGTVNTHSTIDDCHDCRRDVTATHEMSQLLLRCHSLLSATPVRDNCGTTRDDLVYTVLRDCLREPTQTLNIFHAGGVSHGVANI